MSDLTDFSEAYLERWEARATVRGMPRYALPPGSGAESLFPIALQPMAAHPEVVERGEDARQIILVRTCYKWMEDIAVLETDVIGRLCAKVSHQRFAVEVPAAARQVALTVATDEAYHAFAAREFMGQVAEATGIPTTDLDTGYGLGHAAEWLRRTAPDDLRDEFEVMLLCMAENAITDDLVGLRADTEPDNPFHHVVREHLLDEGRHRVYFQNLLRHFWAGMDEDRRRGIGALLPQLLDEYLLCFEPIRRSDLINLAAAGFAPDDAERIADETYRAQMSETGGGKGDIPFAQGVMHLFETAGVLKHGPTRRALQQSGWLAA